jgi:hypothetical protein
LPGRQKTEDRKTTGISGRRLGIWIALADPPALAGRKAAENGGILNRLVRNSSFLL